MSFTQQQLGTIKAAIRQRWAQAPPITGADLATLKAFISQVNPDFEVPTAAAAKKDVGSKVLADQEAKHVAALPPDARASAPVHQAAQAAAAQVKPPAQPVKPPTGQ